MPEVVDLPLLRGIHAKPALSSTKFTISGAISLGRGKTVVVSVREHGCVVHVDNAESMHKYGHSLIVQYVDVEFW